MPSLPNSPPAGYDYTKLLKDAKGAFMAKGSNDPYVGQGVPGTDSIFMDVWSSGGKSIW